VKEIIVFGIMAMFFSGCTPSSTDKGLNQKTAPIQDLSNVQQAENKISKDQAHLANMNFLKSKFVSANKLTDAQKEDLVDCFESQYSKPVLLSEERYKGKVVYFEQIINNLNLTQEQKKAAIKARFAQGNKGQGAF